MQKRSFACQALAGMLYLAGCGGGDGEDGAPKPFAGAPALDGSGMGEALPSAGDAAVNAPAMGAPAASEGMNPDLAAPGALPSGAEPSAPGAVDPALPGVQFGNGRIVGSACTLVCADASTDPDAQGNTDGWGYESDRSCLVPDSALALAGQPCDIPELAPLPAVPVTIPEGNTPRPPGNLSTGFFVSGGRLFDRLGADFVMRGINHPVAWFQDNALAWMDEIATTGSNSVRIVWETNRGSIQILRASIERAIELGMVPMVELHDVTGGTDVNGPAAMAQYYVDDMRDILDDFEPYLLINIANEWGDWFSTSEEWVQAYRQAIGVFRDAGVNHTLVIDSNDNGQRGKTIVDNGAQLLDFDPQHNLLFSTHMYQEYENSQSILDVMRGAQRASLPLIVGEFGYQHGDRNGQPIPVPYEVMLDEAARAGVGYLAWSWTGNNAEVGYLDMSVNGSATQLTGWGDDIINGLNGIRSTSELASIFAAP
jgi:mannan endo-1,4-beta-mannosidase